MASFHSMCLKFRFLSNQEPKYFISSLSSMSLSTTLLDLVLHLIRCFQLPNMINSLIDESGTAENKEELLFSHDKLLLASILRPLHQVTKEMLV